MKKQSKNSNTQNKGQRTPIPAPLTSLKGFMDLTKTEDGLNILDFVCLDYVEMEPFIAECKVQAMRDGYIYITERPRRKRNTPIFRDDNCSFSLGQDDKYYFVFTLPKQQLNDLPNRLSRQAFSIAHKVEQMIASRVAKKNSKK
ncbi:MAG: hypothetical protein J5526_06850 [Bacteroidales bacterium]|nr:hypothetical protein [Bacteroidales bacterium]